MHDTSLTLAPAPGRSILRAAMARVVAVREREARDYVGRRFPALERCPFAGGRERRESGFEPQSPGRA